MVTHTLVMFLAVRSKVSIFADMKTVLITGATSGIGHACAQLFAKRGYRVIGTVRNRHRGRFLVEELTHLGAPEALAMLVDVRNRPKLTQLFEALEGPWAEIDVLVNNAGCAMGLEPEYEGNFSDWDMMIDSNIKGLLNVTRLVVPGMVKRNRGTVINIGSVAGDAAYAGGNVYCATKAAVKALTDGLRIDVAHTALRVCNIKPGLVETNFSRVRFKGDDDRAANVYKGIKPLTAEDIAESVLYVAEAPPHVQIAEMLILATHQANGTVVHRTPDA